MNVRMIKEFGEFRLDTNSKELSLNGVRVALSPKEAEILCLLAYEPGRLVTKEEIVEAVWPDAFVEESNLSRQIYMLRKRLGELGASRDLIENVPRRGYRFNVSVLDADQSTVIEKHVFTQTLLEEINESREFERPEIPVSRIRRMRTLMLAVAGTVIVAAGVSFAAWQLRVESSGAVKTGSLAVVPFRVIGEGDESSGAAMADLLITRLSNVKDFKVRPTTAVIGFDYSDSSVEFGKKLDVDAVLEGTIVRSAEGHRVTARLINVADGNIVWSDEFRAEGNTVLSLYDEIIGEILPAISGGQGPAARRHLLTNNEQAFRYYTKARYQWNRRNSEGMEQASELFRKAIDADPDFVLAKVGLAETLMMGYEHEQATQLLNDAEAADPSRGQIFAAKGFIDLFHHWDWNSAESNFKRAIDLNPGQPSAYQWYATLLTIMGRHDEAKANMQSALEIDPVSANLMADLGQIHYFAGEYDAAERLAKDALAIAPNFAMAHFLLADIYFQRGETDRWAYQFITAGNSLGSRAGSDTAKIRNDPFGDEAKMAAYKKGGIAALEELLIWESETDRNANRFIARAKIFARRGNPAEAIRSLELALSEKAFLMPFVKADPIFRPLRSDPRFKGLLRQMSL